MQAYWFLTVTQLLETPWFLIQPVAYIHALRHWIPLPIQFDLRVVCKNGSLAAWQQLRLIFINLIHLSASGFFYLSNERTFFQSRFFLLLAFIYSWIPLFLRILKLTFPGICKYINKSIIGSVWKSKPVLPIVLWGSNTFPILQVYAGILVLHAGILVLHAGLASRHEWTHYWLLFFW